MGTGILKALLRKKKTDPQENIGGELEAGIRLIEQGFYADACTRLSALVDAHPDSTTVLYNYGAALMLTGETDQALNAFDRAILADQKCWPALINAAAIRLKAGNHRQAISDFKNASQSQDMPGHAALAFAQCLIADGQFAETWALLKIRTHRLHQDSTYWRLAAVACQFSGRFTEAAAALKKVMSLGGVDPADMNRLAQLLTENTKYGEAHTILHHAVMCNAARDSELISFAKLQEVNGDRQQAKSIYEKVLARSNNNTEAITNLGNLLKHDGDLENAELLYRRALALKPESAVLHKNLANLLGMTLRNKEALEELTLCVSFEPNNPYHASDLLFAQQYVSELNLADHRHASENWGMYFGRAAASSVAARFGEGGPLRIGLLSGSFRQHPVGFLALPGLEALDKTAFEIYCYANQVDDDSYTERFKKLSSRWRPVAHLSDDELAHTIREDRIDLLIEMSGHAAGHRLPVVARRVAPVQVKWVGGQFNTLGIDTVDYFLSDPVETPPEFDSAFVEEIYRLPTVYACYQPPADAPKVSPLPQLKNKHLTFGSLNKANKITPETIALWSKCLHAVPNSQLILKGEAFGRQLTVDHAHTQFADHGIDVNRVEMRGFTAHPQILATYQDIDIALDPIPYSGCLTTCEALWMGVPVITLPDGSFASRHSVSFLSAVGLDDWISEDQNHYVELLKNKCSDINSLVDLRHSLRSRMAASPLCDTAKFGADLGIALQKMSLNKTTTADQQAA